MAVSVARNSASKECASKGRQEPNREIRAKRAGEERSLSLGDKLLQKRTNKIVQRARRRNKGRLRRKSKSVSEIIFFIYN